jgi:ABC-2 type transport system ATP-binding protein
MINIRNFAKQYGNKPILHNLNFDLEKGKIYGLVGENGAGKTTLFRCITGLEDHEGSVNCDYGILKNSLGFLPTDPYFFPKMTGKEYLQLLTNARNISPPNFEQINIFDLPLHEYAETYSTGMKKKLALLGVLLQKNEFFILDEPFNGVDIQSNIVIKQLILNLKKADKTVLLCSHIFSTLSDICDIIFVLQNGQITQTVVKNDFAALEQEMMQTMIGDKLDRLIL